MLSAIAPRLGRVFEPTTESRQPTTMDIADWRRKIDEVDRKLVELLGKRAEAVREIGKLKAGAGMPVYEPDREKAVFENAKKANGGPLPERGLMRIFERIVDVMRDSEMEMAKKPHPSDGLGDTEIDSEVND
jgi:chorismate mutase